MNLENFVTLIAILFAVAFIAVFAFILYVFISIISKYIAEKRYNDSQPVLAKDAIVTAKRTNVSGGSGDSSVRTIYFATFEFADNKERAEFIIPFKEFGLLAEDDTGKITFQGRRYFGFVRNV